MSQVNFFMLEDDERELLDAVRGRGDTLLFVGRFHPTARPKPASAIPARERIIVFTPTELAARPVCSARGAGEHAGEFLFDLHSDPHIEMSRCRLRNDVLVSGRIYAKVGWLEDASRNDAYRRWYSSIERWIKKRYRRGRNGWWFGPRAEEWSRAGGRVSYGDSGALVESLRDAT
jgi:hypothetical protein